MFLDGSKVGKIAWKIDLSNSKFNVKSVELLVQSKTFENGKIIWQLLGDAKALLPTPGKIWNSTMHYSCINFVCENTICVTFDGGFF